MRSPKTSFPLSVRNGSRYKNSSGPRRFGSGLQKRCPISKPSKSGKIQWNRIVLDTKKLPEYRESKWVNCRCGFTPFVVLLYYMFPLVYNTFLMHHQNHHYSIVLFLARSFCVSFLLSVVEFLLADLSLNVRADHFESPEGSLTGFGV